MVRLPFRIKRIPRSFLGIDIGTSSIKVVELTRQGKQRELKNYGEVRTISLQKAPFRTIERDSLSLSDKEIAKAIISIIKEAGIQTREVNFSIPDFSSFFTNFELPPMSEQELPQAITYEARSYIPLPLNEVALDWLVVGGEVSDKSENPLKILVVAVPNEVIAQYQNIASLSNLQMKILEAEALALSRSIMRGKDATRLVSVIDIGARSTTCNILEKGILKTSHSFNFSGGDLTEMLSRSLKVDYERAERLKQDFGLAALDQSQKIVREILLPVLDSFFVEIKKIFQEFNQKEGKAVEKIILAGGTALLPGLKEYFSQEFQKETDICSPFFGIVYPPVLEETLKEMGPAYAIALGAALKGFE
jgi:type IV pilus assembly protein PilM